jgi:hypothetical protein
MVAPGTNETDLLEAAASALKIGNVKEARRLLRGVIAKNPANLAAWKLAYQASGSDEERVYSLDAILKLTPNDAWARQRLAEL